MERRDEETFDKFERRVLEIPQVIYCGRFTPEPDYLVNIYATSMDETYEILGYISSAGGVGTIDTVPIYGFPDT